MRFALGGVLLALGLLGCGSDGGNGPDDPGVNGAWEGIVRNNEGGAIGELSLTLNETDGEVSGSGNLGNAGVQAAITVDGTYSPPSLSLILSSDGFTDMNLSAEVGETNIVGELNGSGFINADITLHRP
jgi:hypothetical protein